MKADTLLARHMNYYMHNGDTSTLKFWGITTLKNRPRKGDINKRLLQEEMDFLPE